MDRQCNGKLPPSSIPWDIILGEPLYSSTAHIGKHGGWRATNTAAVEVVGVYRRKPVSSEQSEDVVSAEDLYVRLVFNRSIESVLPLEEAKVQHPQAMIDYLLSRATFEPW